MFDCKTELEKGKLKEMLLDAGQTTFYPRSTNSESLK